MSNQNEEHTEPSYEHKKAVKLNEKLNEQLKEMRQLLNEADEMLTEEIDIMSSDDAVEHFREWGHRLLYLS